jgi:hypothetical protein
MTTSSISTSTDPGQTSTAGVSQGSTTDQAKHAAGVAGQEVKQVASDVKTQARGLLDETKNQVQDQSRTQRDRLVDTLRGFSDDLENMAQERTGLASDAAREVSQRARSFGEQLDGREPSELLDELRAFARRRPGMFLAGAAISGIIVGRILRGTRDAAQDATSSGDYTDEDVTTRERPPASSFDRTMTAPATPSATGAYPPVSPGAPSTEQARPVGGP